MKFKTQVRTGKLNTVRDNEGNFLYKIWETVDIKGVTNGVDDFISKYPPSVMSIGIRRAIERAISEGDKVTYNATNLDGGNCTFYFIK